MSSLTDIQTAIAKLPPGQTEALDAWLDEYRQALNASASAFSMYEDEETTQHLSLRSTVE
jgi:hypothetical protein